MSVSILRIIQIYFIFGSVCILFLFFGIKILKRNPKDRLNQVASSYFITISISAIVNFIYASFSDPIFQPLVNFLYKITIYLLCYATGLLLLIIILLNKPMMIYTTKFQIKFLLIYGGILSGIFLIPNGVSVRIQSDGTQLFPVWSFPFFLYIIIILLTTMIYSFYLCIKIYKKFKSKILVKRIKLLICGIICYFYIIILLCFTHYLNIILLRQISAISGALVVFGGFFFYYSIGTSLKQPFNNLFSQN